MRERVTRQARYLTMVWFVLCAACSGAWAQSTQAPTVLTERLAEPTSPNPALEARVMAIAEELRCLVCQNETIAASHAALAVDLRKQIRVQLGQGRTHDQVLDFMVARYGDFVLYRPPLKASTVLLWAGPFALLLAAGGVLVRNISRRRSSGATAALGDEEAQRARLLLGEVDAMKASRS